jgi:hypothetical protein
MEKELKNGVEAKEAEEDRRLELGMESNENENHEIEQSKIGIMRALVEREDSSAKVLFILFFFFSIMIIVFHLFKLNDFCVHGGCANYDL